MREQQRFVILVCQFVAKQKLIAIPIKDDIVTETVPRIKVENNKFSCRLRACKNSQL